MQDRMDNGPFPHTDGTRRWLHKLKIEEVTYLWYQPLIDFDEEVDSRSFAKGAQGISGELAASPPIGFSPGSQANGPIPQVTILVRLLGWGQFNDKNKAKVARALVLAAKGQATEIRVNTRLNIAAVDTEDRATLEELLAVTVVQNIKVKTRLARPKAQSTGIVRPRFSAGTREEVQENIQAPVNIQGTQVFNGGHTIRVHFDGPLPQRVSLYGIHLPFSAPTPRPKQCGNCGRLGHVRAACTMVNACTTCPEAHKRGTCPRADCPSCPNCAQRHDAFDRRCPAYVQARNVAREMGFSGGGWRAARARLTRRSAQRGKEVESSQTSNSKKKRCALKSKVNSCGSCS
ncbi:hypothetical protein HPB47_011431 [Ixodes persulcatus]|uniref:Uncharacterized protein n=1 Tax=Ixodes persulcatus TaxID=34615 RepID=A0AC60NWA1_IXOPE|nr:hypothetical protein HPB47_011431 [Ixodes persulcatus]